MLCKLHYKLYLLHFYYVESLRGFSLKQVSQGKQISISVGLPATIKVE